MSLQTCLHFFLLWNTKEDVLKSVGKQTVLDPIDFYSIFTHTMELNGTQIHLATNILQNNLFCIPQKKLCHTGLKMMTEFSFLAALSL